MKNQEAQSIGDTVDESVSKEMCRRLEEFEEYLTIVEEERAGLAEEVAVAVREAVGKQVGKIDLGDSGVAWECGEMVANTLGKLKGKAISRAVADAVRAVIWKRLDAAKRYVELVFAARANWEKALPWRVAKLIEERLDRCEDWVHLEEVDWSRIRGILLPEMDDGHTRRHASEQLAQWGRLFREVLPEAYADPVREAVPTENLAGSWEKVEDMAERMESGRKLYSAGDARLRDDEGIVVGQVPGNRKKAASTIDGEPVARLVVSMRADEEETDENWWKTRVPDREDASAASEEGEPLGVKNVGAPSRGIEMEEARATQAAREPYVPAGPKSSKGKKRKAAEENWLPFDKE